MLESVDNINPVLSHGPPRPRILPRDLPCQLLNGPAPGATRLRRRYDAPRTPLERVLACSEIRPEVAAQLQRQRDRLDPFALARAIDQQLERIYALANSRHSPPASPAGPPAGSVPRRVRKRLTIKPAAPAASRRPPSVTSQVAR